MARLIEVQRPEDCPSPLAVSSGDVLLFRASGVRIVAGGSSVESWGPLIGAVLAKTGEVLAPMGSPDAVLIRAASPGRATMEVLTGDPWGGPQSATRLIL